MTTRTSGCSFSSSSSSSSPSDSRLSEEQLMQIRHVAERSSRILAMTKTAYVRSLPTPVLLDKSGQVLKYATAGMTTGACVGMGVALCTGPGVVVVAPISVPVGAGTGFLIGGGIGTVKVYKDTKLEFESWKKSQNEIVMRDFKKMFAEHPDLEICISPISLEPMTTPVHCNCPVMQHTFELIEIVNHLKNNDRCPGSNLPLKPEDLRIDYKTMGLINMAYSKVLASGAKSASLSTVLLQGIKVLSDDLTTMRCMFFKKEFDDISKKLKDVMNSGADPRTLTKRLNDISQLLYIS